MANGGNGGGFKPRVVSDVTDTYGKYIEEFRKHMTDSVDPKDLDSVLRAHQNLTTGFRAAMLGFQDQMGEMDDLYHRAILRKFTSDLDRLFAAKFLRAYAEDVFEVRAKLQPLQKKIIDYFRESNYFVGLSQRFAIPVFPGGYLEKQIDYLSHVLKDHGVNEINAETTFRCLVSDEFKSQYKKRQIVHRDAPPEDPYALCGVHGGKDTPQHSAEASLSYFEVHHRLPFTFMEALSLYTAHPRFLKEQERVLLLGEQYPSGKYAYISSGVKCLEIGLVSLESADAAYAHATLSPHTFHAGTPLLHYGKPSAAALVVDKHL